MNLFKNEYRKCFSKTACILFYVIIILYILVAFGARALITELNISSFLPDYNAISYCASTTGSLIGIIVIFSLISIANTFSIDYTQNTWKNLLCTGTNKNKIQLAKFAFAFAQSLFYLLSTYLLTFIIGCVVFGFDKDMSHTSSSFSFAKIDYVECTESAWAYLAKTTINNIFVLIFFVGFIALIAEVFKGSKHTIVLSFVLYYLSSTVGSALLAIIVFKEELKWLLLLPFSFTNPGFIPTIGIEMLVLNAVSLLYSGIFFTIALLLFKKREIATSK